MIIDRDYIQIAIIFPPIECPHNLYTRLLVLITCAHMVRRSVLLMLLQLPSVFVASVATCVKQRSPFPSLCDIILFSVTENLYHKLWGTYRVWYFRLHWWLPLFFVARMVSRERQHANAFICEHFASVQNLQPNERFADVMEKWGILGWTCHNDTISTNSVCACNCIAVLLSVLCAIYSVVKMAMVPYHRWGIQPHL